MTSLKGKHVKGTQKPEHSLVGGNIFNSLLLDEFFDVMKRSRLICIYYFVLEKKKYQIQEVVHTGLKNTLTPCMSKGQVSLDVFK